MSPELPQTSQSKTYQPTPEQLARWKRLDENDGAIAGRPPSQSAEEQARLVKEFLDIDFLLADQLAKVRMHKEKLLEQLKSLEENEQQEKLLKKLKSDEEYEQLLVEKQQRRQSQGN